MFIRWFWEMDGNKKPGVPENPEQLQLAWKNIVDLFRAQGAPTPCGFGALTPPPLTTARPWRVTPAPSYVDWICADGYNFSPNRPGDKWENFDEIFRPLLPRGGEVNKPIMIGEFGVLEDPANPGREGEWFHIAHD